MNTNILNIKLFQALTFTLVIMLAASSLNSHSQNLDTYYKKSSVRLEEVPGFAAKTNWESLFPDAEKVEYGKNTGLLKEIVVAKDGSIFMCHKTLYEIWKFDRNGNLLKKFGSKGNKPGQFLSHFSIYGLLDGKYLFTSDNQGRMLFFDTEGRFIKKLQLTYMPLEMVPLKDSKIAILGFVVGKNAKDIVAIKDFNTGQEKIIWSQARENLDKSSIVVKIPNEGMISLSLPYSHNSFTSPRLAVSKSGTLLVGIPENGSIAEYSTSGAKLKSYTLKITPLPITDEDIQSNYESFIKRESEFETRINNNPRLNQAEKKETIEQFKSQLPKIKDRSLYPVHLPYFSSLIIDSDGNILVFEFTRDAGSNEFKAYAYDNSGKEIGSSSFVSDSYDLSFIPSSFSFNNGYVYALAMKKKNEKMPLRLVKFKLL
ncbi:MAG: hypothetical protein HXX13_15305 [Bacteroidetes bacterium]|nr:hypothetical protein [Bacteroidota bacterium]